MSKLAIFAISTIVSLALSSASAFAQETSSAKAETVPAVYSKATGFAGKFGSFIGGMVKAPVEVGKAFVSGVRSGLNDSPTASKEATPGEAATVSTVSPVEASATLPFSAAFSLIAKQLRRPASEPLAPVEDRSVTAFAQ